MPESSKIIELRARIQRHLSAPPRQAHARLQTGLPGLDALLEGGLCKGGILEVACPAQTGGVSFLMRAILREAAACGRWSALIDGSDCFDPKSAGPGTLENLLWIRCRKASDAMRSADLLLRDGNLPLIFLDLRGNAAAQLRAIPSTNWYRLQRAIESTSVALVALTAQPLVVCADVRLSLESHLGLDALEDEQEALLSRLHLRITRKRAAAPWPQPALQEAAQ